MSEVTQSPPATRPEVPRLVFVVSGPSNAAGPDLVASQVQQVTEAVNSIGFGAHFVGVWEDAWPGPPSTPGAQGVAPAPAFPGDASATT